MPLYYYRQFGAPPSLSQIRDLANENLKKVGKIALGQKFGAKTENLPSGEANKNKKTRFFERVSSRLPKC